jgi:uncharacterized protein YwqG
MGLFDSLSSLFKKKEYTAAVPSKNEQALELTEIFPSVNLPKWFIPYKPMLEKTRLEYISIKATKAEELSLEESKFGYYPFMPLDFDYPKDESGEYMFPLAQINFKDFPALKDYPCSGYLQFYISGHGDVYGVDFDNSQSQTNFRMLFFEEEDIKAYKADFSFLDEVMAQDQLPLNTPYKLSFELKHAYIGIGDARYEASEHSIEKIVINHARELEEELTDSVNDECSNSGHKIGGYAHFAQDDPRAYSESLKDYILLFQMDSDDQIMWGDAGVANFFIHKDDLIKKDFSKVMYTWDCY